MLCIRILFFSSSVKLLIKEHVHRDREWVIHRSTNTDTHSRGESVLFFSVYLSSEKQQSSLTEHIHVCVSIHPHFFVYTTTGALEAAGKHDQTNTEPLISQQKENMLPYLPLEQRWTFLTLCRSGFFLSWMMTELKKWAVRRQHFVFSICITIPDLSLTFNRDLKFLISP